MSEKKEKYPSTFTIDNFSSTATLANNDTLKVDIPSSKEKELESKEYDPYQHRTVEHPNTFSGALIHLLKSSLGTGILAIPSAFMEAGLVVGLVGTLIIGFICTHTIHILVQASIKMCQITKTPSLGFAETAEAVFKNGPVKYRRFSTFAKYFVEVALVLTYYMGNAVYVVFVTASLVDVFPEWGLTDQYYKLILLLPLIICCQVRDLKHLVPFSFIANATMIVAFSITLYYLFAGLPDINISDVKLAKGISGLPLYFSTVIFAMEGIGTVMPVENSMVTGRFIGCPGVLNTAMLAVTLLYSTIGFFGYLRYADSTKPTITMNLPEHEIPARVAKVCISVAVFFTFMLQFYVPLDITWRHLKERIPKERHNICQILLRTGLVIIIVGVAAAAGDKLGPLISLVGAIFFSTLGLTVPAIIDIIINIDNPGKFKWRLIKDLIILALALFGMFSGSYFAILDFK